MVEVGVAIEEEELMLNDERGDARLVVRDGGHLRRRPHDLFVATLTAAVR